MFKATNFEKSKRNKPTYQSKNKLSSCGTSDHYLSLSLQRLRTC